MYIADLKNLDETIAEGVVHLLDHIACINDINANRHLV